MTDDHNPEEVVPSESAEVTTPENDASVMVWSSSSGESKLLHAMQIDETGIAWLLNISKPKILEELIGRINENPDQATSIISAESKGKFLPREQLARVSYTEGLSQLLIIDTDGKKHKVTDGEEGEQRQIFEAVRQHLGGDAGEEEADAWSVMQGPLLGLVITAAAGGFMVFLATEADPSKEFTGRRRGMKQLLNWLGYTIGPTWMGVIAGTIFLGIFAYMIMQLVKRPVREFLAFKTV
ncbi:hypothetical protein Pan153_36030 [Gimesia panareensis]|uniref:Uncharacterized protein n=1 Tax=Gimesia panareensis TaxID=2527978 RepID=A0A518FRG4_9PLAN|nr:hypothetical protein [Gimesia panareensis]QDV18942.1 hypothetical protein Pan153_36030 [Gimesia panareensis]